MEFRGRTPKEIAEDPTASSLEMDLAKALIAVNLQFEEARKIIAEVSYSPEFKKWHYNGAEQDPCGVHAFTSKYAEKPKRDHAVCCCRSGHSGCGPGSHEHRNCTEKRNHEA